jgi:HPt (histidine-containing phosphotransfer) domain-containing protein
MIALFLNSLAEYISDLEQQITEQQITDLHKIIHKLKPSVLSLEVKGARNELAIIDAATAWTPQVQESVERLLQTFKTIRPMMQEDLEAMKDE